MEPRVTPYSRRERAGSVDSTEEGDPLAMDSMKTPGRNAQSSPFRFSRPSQATGATQQRLTVLLPSPNKVTTTDYAEFEESVSEPVESDVSSQFKRRKIKEAPVPLPTMLTSSTVHPTAPQPSSGRRGRPKGWKAGMGYAELRGSKPANALLTAKPAAGSKVPVSTESKKKRGRPPKALTPPPMEVYKRLNPPWFAFLCEWAGCQAELQNLQTLKRHVYIVHHQRNPDMDCRWGRCGQGGGVQGFPDAEAFERHMEQSHLIPLSWHAGDGASNEHPSKGVDSLEDEGVPDFLKDKNGIQVTPWVRHQEIEDDATWKSNRRKLKELLIRMNDNLPDEEESTDDNSATMD
ncbi:hypothetical protein S40293_03069 [Stachybotrys chartarum IBT 40293]|nr:hypothetical protein S40293_03069 [Stachybotrys chartarum IBT 40293]